MKKNLVFSDGQSAVAITGGALVADFTAAITNLSTAETAKYVAEQSELNTMSSIEAASQGQYVMPQYISPDDQASLVRSSLDAHIKKVQAEQLTSFTWGQIAQMEADDKQKFCGRKVRVTVLEPASQPIESYWYNNNIGQYTSGYVKSRVVKGIIDDISLSKNMIVLKPTLTSRLVLPGRKYFAVFVINPQTLSPLVDLAIIG